MAVRRSGLSRQRLSMQVMKRVSFFLLLWSAAASVIPSARSFAQTTNTTPGPGTGALYSSSCASCHEVREAAPSHVPDHNALTQMSPESIYRSLSINSPAAHAGVVKLTGQQKRDVAEFLTGRP